MRAGRTGGRPLVILLALTAMGVTAAVGWLLASRLIRASANPIPLPLRHIGVVALPGGSTRFDYADLDPGTHRLFLSHLDDNTLLVVDTATRQVIRTVTGLPEVTGVIVVPSLHRVFASAAGAGQVVTLDEDTNTVLGRAPAGSFPDGLAYVPTTGQVWISDEDGGAETVIDAITGQRVATVTLPGQAGNVRYDPVGDRVLVDVQSRDEIVVIRSAHSTHRDACASAGMRPRPRAAPRRHPGVCGLRR